VRRSSALRGDLFAQDDKPKDAEGCKDSPLITRFPGSIINSCDNKEYEQADLLLGDDKVKHVEGEFHSWDIATREGTSEIQVFRNFQTAIKNAGFTIDFILSPSQIVGHKARPGYSSIIAAPTITQTIVTKKEMRLPITVPEGYLGRCELPLVPSFLQLPTLSTLITQRSVVQIHPRNQTFQSGAIVGELRFSLDFVLITWIFPKPRQLARHTGRLQVIAVSNMIPARRTLAYLPKNRVGENPLF